jgi:hypothetical protein
MMLGTRALILFTVMLGLAPKAVVALPIPDNPGWEPIEDEVYLQETARRFETEVPLLAVAVLGDTAYVGDQRGVRRVEGDTLVAAGGPRSRVHRLRVLHGSLWAIGSEGVWRYADAAWTQVASGPYVDVCAHLNDVIVASQEHVYRLDGDTLVPLNSRASASPILGVQSYSETIYVRHRDRLGFLDGDRFEYDDVGDWNKLPIGSETRDMLALGSRLLVPSDRGLGMLRGMSWHTVLGADGLCYEDTTCAAAGFAGDYWIGTARGAVRAVDGAFQYFGHEMWIPHDKVNAIASGARTVYIATDGGLGIIAYEPFTLQKKAAWYKRYLREWGKLRLGLVTGVSRNADGTYARGFGDNDVGFTCHYLDALCFEYAVTGDPAVRDEAVNVFKTIKWSEEITPIKGYPARSICAVDEPGHRGTLGSAGRPAEWHLTGDGVWQWKGDTSSDEIVAHVYTVSLFHDLVAQGIEKEKAVEHLERIIGHIVDNGWVLRDLDGKPTVWGQWSPEFVFSPDHTDERGLNSLQALSFVAVANALFPSAKFERARDQLIAWGYVRQTLRQKITFPYYTRFDDRLAFLSYYPLLRYETDPAVRAPVMRSLQRSWEVKRIEQQTWFNYIYGALTGNDCGNPEAVNHLRAYPLDCTAYSYTNSHRHDLQNPAGYINYLENWRPLTPRDVGWQRWNRSFQQLDKKGSGAIQDPSGWLDAYWMGRYYGMILPPETTDPALITVEERNARFGPAPYQGPARPDIF